MKIRSTIDPNIDEKNLEISFSVASDTPCWRVDENGQGYLEILEISDRAINRERLDLGASVLKNHDTDETLGIVTGAWIQDEVLVVRVRFRKNSAKAVQTFRDIVDGTVKNVSIGYEQNKIQFSTDEKGERIGRVVEWTPYEVSVDVGVPADAHVGFFRKFENINIKKEKEMNEDEKKDLTDDEEKSRIEELEKENSKLNDRVDELEEENDKLKSENTDEEKSEDIEEKNIDEEKSTDEENSRRRALRSMGDALGARHLVATAIKKGIGVGDFSAFVQRQNTTPRARVLSEPSGYNFIRALQASVTPSLEAPIERRRSAELYRQFRMEPSSPNSMIIDFREMGQVMQRQVDITQSPGLLGTQHRPDLYIEALRERLAFTPNILSGLIQNLDIPRQTEIAVAQWGEVDDSAAETGFKVEPMILAPKKLSAFIPLAYSVLAQGQPDAINIALIDLLNSIAMGIESAIIYGDATTQIDGILNTDGVQVNQLGALNASKWEDWTKFAGMIGAWSNIQEPQFVMSSTSKSILKAVSKDAGSGQFICEDSVIDEYKVGISGMIKNTDETVIFGNHSEILLGSWGAVELVLDPYDNGNAKKGKIDVIARALHDIKIRQPKAFVVSKGTIS